MRKFLIPAVILVFCLGLLVTVAISLVWDPNWVHTVGGILRLLIVAALGVLGVIGTVIALIKNIRDLRAVQNPSPAPAKTEIHITQQGDGANIAGGSVRVEQVGGMRIQHAEVVSLFPPPKKQAPPPFMVDSLPENFIERPQEFEAILAALLESSRAEPGTSAHRRMVSITAALKGAGGFGKTTLARAVCWDERIRAAFSGGILWVTLGESAAEPALVEKIANLVRLLGDEWPGYTEIGPAAADLRARLKDRHILLVVDDVWQRAHLEPFSQPGSHTVVLATTRNADTLPAGVCQVNVDEMRRMEAAHLLRSGLLDAEDFNDDTLGRCLDDFYACGVTEVFASVASKALSVYGDDMPTVVGPGREKADQEAAAFVAKYEKVYPTAVECLKRDLDDCLTFYGFPEKHWKYIRTSNIIERLFGEVKKRSHKMAATFRNEDSCLAMFYAVIRSLNLRRISVPGKYPGTQQNLHTP